MTATTSRLYRSSRIEQKNNISGNFLKFLILLLISLLFTYFLINSHYILNLHDKTEANPSKIINPFINNILSKSESTSTKKTIESIDSINLRNGKPTIEVISS